MDHLGSGREWDLTRKRGGLNLVPPYAEANVKMYRGRVEALASIVDFLADQKEAVSYTHLDAGFLFSVDEETFFTEHLAEGLTLDDGQLDELLRKSDAQRAKDKAFGYLSAREHASGELFQKLCRDFDEHTAAAAVAKMDELGLLNDEAFARRAVEWLLSKNKSRSEILRWMDGRGVDRDLARQALEEVYEERQADVYKRQEHHPRRQIPAGLIVRRAVPGHAGQHHEHRHQQDAQKGELIGQIHPRSPPLHSRTGRTCRSRRSSPGRIRRGCLLYTSHRRHPAHHRGQRPVSAPVLRLAAPDEAKRVVDFVNANFDWRLPLINREEYFNFYYKSGNALQFALAEEEGVLVAAAGYIRASDAPDADVWVSVWVCLLYTSRVSWAKLYI